MQTLPRLIVLILSPLLLCSCIEVFQYVAVKDGVAEVSLRYTVQKSIMEMGASFSGDEVDYSELMDGGDVLAKEFEGIEATIDLFENDLEIGVEINARGTMDEITSLQATEVQPFFPIKHGETYRITITGSGEPDSTGEDEMVTSFLASSKYRILVDLTDDLSEINAARFRSGLKPEEQSLINIHQYGHMMLIEFPMLIPLSNTETFEIELYQK